MPRMVLCLEHRVKVHGCTPVAAPRPGGIIGSWRTERQELDHGGSIMSRITGEELRRRRAAFVDKAGQAFDQMLGDDGQNGLVTFEEREDRACDLGDGLTRRLLADHLAADESANPGVEVACPLCGKAVHCDAPPAADQAEMQKRAVRTRRGTVELARAARRCSRCRRIFFPAG
jgi:hypothetical protein